MLIVMQSGRVGIGSGRGREWSGRAGNAGPDVLDKAGPGQSQVHELRCRESRNRSGIRRRRRAKLSFPRRCQVIVIVIKSFYGGNATSARVRLQHEYCYIFGH